jgi:undecaprenyl-diphosphatase
MDYLSNLDSGLLHTLNGPVREYAWYGLSIYYIATWGVLVFAVFCLGLWFEKTPQQKIRFNYQMLSLIIFALLIAFFSDQVISNLISRVRPYITYTDITALHVGTDTTSFPSSHALYLFATSISVYFARHDHLGAWLIFIALVISTARIAAGVHYPSDILGGAILGLLIAYAVANKKSIIYKQLFKN